LTLPPRQSWNLDEWCLEKEHPFGFAFALFANADPEGCQTRSVVAGMAGTQCSEPKFHDGVAIIPLTRLCFSGIPAVVY
ncbi:MAG: hypothetical protein ACRD3A_02570, partial [Terriglobales bacterium]